MSNNHYGEQPFNEDPTNIQEAIPHSGKLPEDMRETPVRDFGTSLEDAHNEGLIQTPDSPHGLAPEPSSVAPHDPTPTQERLTVKEINDTRSPMPPTPPFPQVAPVAPERHNNTKRNIALGVVGALAAVGIGSGATFLLGKKGGDNEATPAPTKPVATAPATPGATESSVPNEGSHEQQPVTVGNIDLASGLYSYGPSASDPSEDAIRVNWGMSDGSEDIDLGKLLGPNNYNPTQRAASALSLISAVISADLKHSDQLLPYYTDNAQVASAAPKLNAAFQASAKPENQNKYVDQLDFFDTAQDPVTFVEGPLDANGYPTLQLSTGTLYAERVTGGEWQNPANFDVAKAVPITQMSISYKPSANGSTMSIENFDASVEIDGSEQAGIGPILQVKN